MTPNDLTSIGALKLSPTSHKHDFVAVGLFMGPLFKGKHVSPKRPDVHKKYRKSSKLSQYTAKLNANV